MSIVAALADYLADHPIVYVDYAKYLGTTKIPLAGNKCPRLLANPLDVFGDLELRDIFAAFDSGNFLEAEHLVSSLESRLYEPREVECLEHLAGAYGHWD